MNCADLESLLCDFVDGTLAAEQKATVERHLEVCPHCAELARDAAAAVSFMERAEEVQPPPELLTRLLFEPPWGRSRPHASSWRARFRHLVQPVLQPRFAMGMAMTLLSFAMLARFVAPMRQLRPEDLQPARIWAALDDRVYRGWQRSVKFYENLRFVYQIQSRLRDWQQEQDQDPQAAPDSKGDQRRLPLKNQTGGTPPAARTGAP